MKSLILPFSFLLKISVLSLLFFVTAAPSIIDNTRAVGLQEQENDALDFEKDYLHPSMNEAKDNEQPGDLLILQPSNSSSGGMTLRNTVSRSDEKASGPVAIPVFRNEVLSFLIALLALVGARRLRR